MQLLLMRHGEAVDEAPGLGDAGRWLTRRGRDTTREVARWVAAHHPPTEILSSSLVRAVQTAEIVAAAVDLRAPISAHPEVSSGDLRALVGKLALRSAAPRVMVVGHEPILSELLLTLTGDLPWRGFKKSAVCAVAWSGAGASRFEWSLDPDGLSVSHSP